jgi:hypothetical protein
MPRYVILEHDHPTLHWDLMLEAGESLHTWRLAALPSPDVGIDALRVGEHRLHYLDYEGPVSGGRGVVSRWDRGVFEWVEQTERVVAVRLHGTRWTGALRLEWQEHEHWLAFFRALGE